MTCSRLKVVPKISSHSAGWIARVTSSVRSWRIFWISTRQNVAMRLPSHRHAGGGGAGASGTSAEAAGDAPRATNVTELSSLLERITGVVTEHVLERRLGSEAGFELAGCADRADAAAVHERHTVAELLGLLHVVRREQHRDPLGLKSSQAVPDRVAPARIDPHRRRVGGHHPGPGGWRARPR